MIYTAAKRIWNVLPPFVRNGVRGLPFMKGLPGRMRERLARSASHDELYDEEYFREIDVSARKSAGIMAESIVESFAPASVLDVGCGSGAMLDALRAIGVTARGLEYSEAALALCRERGLAVEKFDLERIGTVELAGIDLAVSMEVAEHLPESCAERYVDLLCQAAGTIVFTAAPPGQGGHDHVNEQPREYWIAKFARRGFEPDVSLAAAWSAKWKEHGVAFWYWNNLMIFRRAVS